MHQQQQQQAPAGQYYTPPSYPQQQPLQQSSPHSPQYYTPPPVPQGYYNQAPIQPTPSGGLQQPIQPSPRGRSGSNPLSNSQQQQYLFETYAYQQQQAQYAPPQQQPYIQPQQPYTQPQQPYIQPQQQQQFPPSPYQLYQQHSQHQLQPQPQPQSQPPPLQQQPYVPPSAPTPSQQSPATQQRILDTTTLLKLFNLADKDGSGTLTSDELIPIVRGVVRPGIAVTSQHAEMLMQLLDKDQSGTITIDEFLDGAKKFNWNSDALSELITSYSVSRSQSSTEDLEIQFKDLLLREKIGEGTFGLVYKGEWRGSPVAVKMLKMQNITESALQEFRKELQILGKLRHPNIVLLMGASTIPPNLTFVTEFLNGGSLFDALRNKTIPMDMPLFKRLAREIAQGMNYLHCSNIIHRDLKSLNILLDQNKTVKICDFGLSRVKKDSDVMTKKIGSPIWMAPELIKGEDYNEKVDVYAYGIVLWEIGTSELPYPNMDSIQIAVAVSSKGLRPPLPDKWPIFVKELAKQCWHEQPAQRPSFQQVLEKINSWS